MILTDQDLEEFRDIYRKEFGEEITIDEARRMGTNLINLFLIMEEKRDDRQSSDPALS